MAYRDFGIAYALGDEGAGSSGTPSFAAPEQLLGEAQGPATDCYALASIVYFVLTGKPPFGEGTGSRSWRSSYRARCRRGSRPTGRRRVGRSGFCAGWPAREDRFGDAIEMRIAWRQLVRTLRRAEDARPWWRRLIEGAPEDGESAPSSDW